MRKVVDVDMNIRGAAAALALVALAAAGCSSGGGEGTSPPTEASSEPAAEPTAEEPTAEEPTTQEPAAEPALGDHCVRFEGAEAEVKAIVEPVFADPVGPLTAPLEPSDLYEEGVRCELRSAASEESNITRVTVTEWRFADEEAASLDDARDPAGDPNVFSMEDLDLGDDALSFTYLVMSPTGSAVSYSIFVREGDRQTHVLLREVPDEALVPGQQPPAEEVDRRATVLELAELIGPWG